MIFFKFLNYKLYQLIAHRVQPSVVMSKRLRLLTITICQIYFYQINLDLYKLYLYKYFITDVK